MVMGMREKLIELLSENISEFCKLSVIRGTTKITAITLDADRFAGHLIANGVTIPVRCKDCRYYIPKVDGTVGFCKCGEVCGYLTTMRVADDFCSYGERRTDA